MTLRIVSIRAGVVDTLPPADDRLYGPHAFGAGWLVVGIVAVVLAVAIAVWVFRPAGPAPIVAQPRPVVTVRARFLGLIDDLERQLADHRLDERELHHELSRTLRRFAAEVGTAGAPAMSAAALDEAGQQPVAVAVRSYEVPQFAELPDGDPAAAIETAKGVVTGWRST